MQRLKSYAKEPLGINFLLPTSLLVTLLHTLYQKKPCSWGSQELVA